MADRWEIKLSPQGDPTEVWCNGAWYSDVEDEHDGIGLVRNRRGTEVVIVSEDGLRETRRL